MSQKDLIGKVRSLRTAMDSSSVALDARESIQVKFVAALVACQLDIPSGRIEGNPKIHFMNIHTAAVNEIVGAVNEEVVVPIDLVKIAVYDIWKERYELVHYPIKAVTLTLKSLFPADSNDINFITQIIGAD
jgi:hypothetical protein